MDTTNKFHVSKMGSDTVILKLNIKVDGIGNFLPARITQDEALNLAAWIVAVNDKEKFDKLYEEIIKT